MMRSAHSGPNGRQEIAARLLTWVYALGIAVALFLWIVSHGQRRDVTPFVELAFSFLNLPVSGSLVSVVVLVLLTSMLLGRKRAGLALVAGFQVLGIAFGLAVLARVTTYSGPRLLDPWSSRFAMGPGLDIAATLSGVLLLGLSWWLRPAFPGRVRRGSWSALLASIAGGLALAGVTAWWLLYVYEGSRPSGHLWRQVVRDALGLAGGLVRPRVEGVPGWIPEIVSLVIAAGLLLGAILFSRSARNPHGWSPDREIALRRLLARYGERDSLGYFATRRDKACVFSADEQAAVCYDVVAGVCLATGDPVGDPASWGQAIRAWKTEARHYGWIPAVLGVGEEGARAYIAAGFDALALGDEAILEPAHFRINNTSMTPVRRAAARARREGLSVQLRRQDEIDARELHRLFQAADAWRDGQIERGFSMALDRHGDPADGRTLIVTAHAAGAGETQSSDSPDPARAGGEAAFGDLRGLLTFVPWGQRGLSLDLMRRDPAAPHGTNELLVTELMAHAADFGVRRVSLNFAFLRGVFVDAERLGAGVLTRLNSSLLGVFDRFFQLERLYRANQKYEPAWSPRYLCVDSRVSMPLVAIACGVAEGFLPRWFHTRRMYGLDAEHLALVQAAQAGVEVDVAALAPARDQQTRARLEHLAALTADGRSPSSTVSPHGRPVGSLTRAERAPGAQLEVHARVRTIRDHGGVVFVDLLDGQARLQVLLDRQALGPRLREIVRRADVGDLVVVSGAMGTSRSGTPVLVAEEWAIAAKALHPLPYVAFTDPDLRLRQRSVDLLVHPQEARLLRVRGQVVSSLRSTLDRAGYLEVETPILQAVHGGASARPFTTFINAYGVDLSLRIAPELYLKRLVVAGLGPVYEVGRNFRNEGADATHNPEFTSLEAYEPFGDYTAMRRMTQRLIQEAATAVYGEPVLPLRLPPELREAAARGERPVVDPSTPVHMVDISGDWPVVTVLDAIGAAIGRPVRLDGDFDELLALAREHGVIVRPQMGPGAVVEALYGEVVEPGTVYPTFYTDFPVETSPLAAGHPVHPLLAQRWDLVASGMEVGTANTELTDPVEQRRRLTEQSLKAAAGDVEAMELDEDFLRALEVGMPPTGGLGIGVDRLVMLLTGTTIRQILSFPFVRPKGSSRG